MRFYINDECGEIWTETEVKDSCNECNIFCSFAKTSTPCNGEGIICCQTFTEVELSDGMKKLIKD